MLLFFAATVVLSMVFCRLLIVYAPKDSPDGERKQQVRAVPTSGGLAIAAAAGLVYIAELILVPAATSGQSLGGLAGVHLQFLNASGQIWHILLAGIVLILGALDDARALSARNKLMIMAAACLVTAIAGFTADKIFVPIADSTLSLPVLVSVIGSAFWLFLMMNATNFMDGSNGLALGCIAIMLTAIGLSFIGNPTIGLSPETVTVWSGLSFVILLLVAAICGFLIWNMQGLLYAGDAGALFAGTVFASFGLLAAQSGNVWFVATLALPFLIDVVATLIWRARRGENLLEGHRDHAYQVLRRSGWSHWQTAVLWWAMTGACALLALWAMRLSPAMSFVMFVLLSCFLTTLWLMQRAHWSAVLAHAEAPAGNQAPEPPI